MVKRAVKAAVRRWVSPQRLLRQLLRLDNGLYHLTSRVAVWYGEGLHPKHRLTGYHDFFVENIRPGERVLDIGCGVGALAYDVALRAGARVTAVDHDGAAIGEARRRHRHENLQFIQGDAWDVPGGEAFEVVVLSNVLEHLEKRVAFLRIVRERLTPKRILIRVPLFDRDWRVPLKREMQLDWRLDPTHQVEYTDAEFLSEVRAAGLEVERIQVRWGEIWAICVPSIS